MFELDILVKTVKQNRHEDLFLDLYVGFIPKDNIVGCVWFFAAV
jgi:hypothetical protein